MKQTWGLKILNTSTYFFHSTSVPPSLKCFIVFEKNQTTKYAQCVHFITWEEEGFVHIGGQHLAVPDVSLFLLCFEQPKFFFPHFLFLHLYSSLIREKKLNICIYTIDSRRAYLYMILSSSIMTKAYNIQICMTFHYITGSFF